MLRKDLLRFGLWSADEVVLEASPALVGYEEAVRAMDRHVLQIRERVAPERLWLLEHPPIYTAGTSATDSDLVDARFPVHRSGRGGQYTYHGPGQRVAYVMLDLKRRGCDVRSYVAGLEEWLIRTLGNLGVLGERREDRVGVWVKRPGETREEKIAAIGVRVRHWVSFHGISLNVNPDLSHFLGIVPCGLREHGVTSLADLGIDAQMPVVDRALIAAFADIFGPVRPLP